MKLAPLAEFDDGLLDVLIADGVTRAGIIRELTRVWDGTHIENTQIIMLRARKIRDFRRTSNGH
jgi:diacylglycerol kinase family enzyme